MSPSKGKDEPRCVKVAHSEGKQQVRMDFLCCQDGSLGSHMVEGYKRLLQGVLSCGMCGNPAAHNK